MVIVIMGVAGAGKSTIGKLLSKDLGWPFYEGDDRPGSFPNRPAPPAV